MNTLTCLKVWMPDTFFRNEKEGQFHNIIQPNLYVRVFPNGDVLYSIRVRTSLLAFVFSYSDLFITTWHSSDNLIKIFKGNCDLLQTILLPALVFLIGLLTGACLSCIDNTAHCQIDSSALVLRSVYSYTSGEA